MVQYFPDLFVCHFRLHWHNYLTRKQLGTKDVNNNRSTWWCYFVSQQVCNLLEEVTCILKRFIIMQERKTCDEWLGCSSSLRLRIIGQDEKKTERMIYFLGFPIMFFCHNVQITRFQSSNYTGIIHKPCSNVANGTWKPIDGILYKLSKQTSASHDRIDLNSCEYCD